MPATNAPVKAPIQPRGALNGNGMSRSALAAADSLYRRTDLYHLNVHLIRAIIALSVALVISMGLNIAQFATPARHTYFATEPNGAIIPLVPLSTPIMTDSALMDWTVRSVTQAFTLTWSNYRGDEEGALPAFTTNAQKDYLAGLERYKIIELLTTQGENLSCVVTGAPVITQKSVGSNGIAFWVLQIPMVWTYSAGGTSTQQTTNNAVTATVLVVRAPETQAPAGLLISQINVVPRA